MRSNSDIKNMDVEAMIKQLDVGDVDHVHTRFAPSPNGYLHEGHALSALLNQKFAHTHGGTFMLRIEDIDASRSRAEFCDAIIDDMRWLGLHWDGDIIYQSMRIESYRNALETLQSKGLLYPCFCSRSDISAALIDKPVKHGPDGPHYPGTCRPPEGGSFIDSEKRMRNELYAWRLDIAKALRDVPPLYWHDSVHGPQLADPSLFGDVVIWRKDAPASYHLAATCDDAADNISHVIRGMDLFAYTALHRLLQYLLGLSVPRYWHHKLLLDPEGEKLSKSNDSSSLAQKRAMGVSPDQILKFSA